MNVLMRVPKARYSPLIVCLEIETTVLPSREKGSDLKEPPYTSSYTIRKAVKI